MVGTGSFHALACPASFPLVHLFFLPFTQSVFSSSRFFGLSEPGFAKFPLSHPPHLFSLGGKVDGPFGQRDQRLLAALLSRTLVRLMFESSAGSFAILPGSQSCIAKPGKAFHALRFLISLQIGRHRGDCEQCPCSSGALLSPPSRPC